MRLRTLQSLFLGCFDPEKTGYIVFFSFRRFDLLSSARTTHFVYEHDTHLSPTTHKPVRTYVQTPTPTPPGLALIKNTLRCAMKSYTKVSVPYTVHPGGR